MRGRVELPLFAHVASLPEDSPATAIAVLGNDSSSPDSGETLTITGVTQGPHGTVIVTGGGTGLTYQPNGNFTGNATNVVPGADPTLEALETTFHQDLNDDGQTGPTLVTLSFFDPLQML